MGRPDPVRLGRFVRFTCETDQHETGAGAVQTVTVDSPRWAGSDDETSETGSGDTIRPVNSNRHLIDAGH
ncbi:unnamed protein product [Protopolystoma xenopodis]|uniref:Uncharacterized protein n=1 Tax=Protopolystoma xenopodis TaxID=117903 RepID=A0A3S5C7T8_9PLAT|nr:unnamed protein product [Protopolystoma xenopodis]